MANADFVKDICKLLSECGEYGVPKINTSNFYNSEFVAHLKNDEYDKIPKIAEWDINNFWINSVKQVENAEQSENTERKYIKISSYKGGLEFYSRLLDKPHSNDQEIAESINAIRNEYEKTRFREDGKDSDIFLIQKFFNNIQENMYKHYTESDRLIENYKFIIEVTTPTLDIYYLCIKLDNSAVYMSKDGKDCRDIDINISVIKQLNYRYIYFGEFLSCFLLIPENNISKFSLWISLQDFTNKSSGITDFAQLSYMSHISMNTEQAGHADIAEMSGQSESSTIADDLTEDGVTRLIDRLATDIVTTRQDILDNIEKKIAEKQLERELRYNMSVYSGEFNTLNIYKDSDINDALEILNNTGRLLITGGTGDGKTELAYLLANRLTGEAVGKPLTDQDNNCYNRICIVSARNGYSLTNSKKTGIIDKFIKHIIDNNIQDNCVFICNEVQASDMGYLLGDILWENFNDSKKTSLLPSNLKLIFTGCKNRDFGIDSQITERIKHIELSYLSADSDEVNSKLITLLKSERPDVEKILKLVETINDNEEYGVITLRKLFNIVRYNKLELNVDIDMLSSNSIRAKDKLESLIGGGDEG